ncbi:prolyl 4-hydroxylase subunit alpha-1-like [Sycon ciliatum]|uniref:prolyl 4-hydroxylase subunit alpha-1-like n=1 Tax=Sycon ciliatum TaxID=27933 RepID=UPI0020AD9FFC|eukprot:scpid12336/ scgid6271/ Prolyl 4-hydroxylase subunit alpha-1; Procollagen-proline,2-oxoglutarate-4-dioxygenase subunit alpha-1
MEASLSVLTGISLMAAVLLSMPAHGEVFSALTHFSSLVKAEERLASELQAYIAAEQERIAQLHRFAGEVKQAVHSSSRLGPEEHIGHPTNAFLMVRRFTHDWQKLKFKLQAPPKGGNGLMSMLDQMQSSFPTTADITGTATALMRLQETYRLNVSAMADGQAGSLGQRLQLADIFSLGVLAYNDKQYFHAKRWLQECLRRVYSGAGDPHVTEAGVIDFLAFTEYNLGNIRRAIRWTKKLAQLNPGNARATSNLKYYLTVFREQVKNGSAFIEKKKGGAEKPWVDHVWLQERDRYKQLCREPIETPDFVAESQVCFYSNRNRTPRLILRPAKVEVAWVKPTVLLYRDIVSESEINRLKELATPRLKRATVHSPVTGKLEFADYRVSKSGWLAEWHDNSGVVDRINTRITDYTGLSMTTAELLQVVNYGIGGQYEPHYDHARKTEKAFEQHVEGNRIATMLFYLSNVTSGGCTVFTKAGARIAPSKGDATFWYNLLPSGEGDEQTRHAGCPVLSGSKWVCNKWIHERDQEFLKPCKLNEFDEWDIHKAPEFL